VRKAEHFTIEKSISPTRDERRRTEEGNLMPFFKGGEKGYEVKSDEGKVRNVI